MGGNPASSFYRKLTSLAGAWRAGARPADMLPSQDTARDAAPGERPSGLVVWIHGPDAAALEPVMALLPRLSENVGETVSAIVTSPQPAGGAPEGPNIGWLVQPGSAQAAGRFLEIWRPDLGLIVGADLPETIIRRAPSHRIPRYWVNARLPRPQGRWRGKSVDLPFEMFASIFPATRKDALDLRQAGADPTRIDVEGQLREVPSPLPCNDYERDALARRIGSRPVWLAAGVGPAEVEAVSRAHRHAARMSHRLLLVVVAEAGEEGKDIAHRFEADGWTVGLRSAGDRPDSETEVFVGDMPGEMGLWYRMAPVSFMATTLSPAREGPSPFDPATLGSAVIHGPYPGQHAPRYERLTVAGATRAIGSAADLGPAVAELLAPDKTAALAEAAWRVTSEGAEVSDRVREALAAALEGAWAPS